MPTDFFFDRTEAGKLLARPLARSYACRDDVLVLALPRGGVPVAFEIANELHAPLDLFLVRKLGVPGEEELAMGAIATGGIVLMNHDIVRSLRVMPEEIHQVIAAEQAELQRREMRYRAGRPLPIVRDRTVIVVDDGLATGASMKAALTALRRQHPRRLIVAVPVAPRETCQSLEREYLADEVVCLAMPEPFGSIGLHYGQFDQVTDQEVRDLLEKAADNLSTTRGAA
jgi:putative phosphoribosyl transferase